MKKFQVGIIGSGFGANVHAPILKLHPGFELRATCQPSIEVGRERRVREEGYCLLLDPIC